MDMEGGTGPKFIAKLSCSYFWCVCRKDSCLSTPLTWFTEKTINMLLSPNRGWSCFSGQVMFIVISCTFPLSHGKSSPSPAPSTVPGIVQAHNACLVQLKWCKTGYVLDASPEPSLFFSFLDNSPHFPALWARSAGTCCQLLNQNLTDRS